MWQLDPDLLLCCIQCSTLPHLTLTLSAFAMQPYLLATLANALDVPCGSLLFVSDAPSIPSLYTGYGCLAEADMPYSQLSLVGPFKVSVKLESQAFQCVDLGLQVPGRGGVPYSQLSLGAHPK